MVIQYHPTIGHLFVPNLKARIPFEHGGYFVQTNGQGFRSHHEFSLKRKDRPRLLFFGDSLTAGDGCDNQERFTDIIENSLGVEVFNYGLSGSGTDQQLLILEHLAKGIEADLIVLCVGVENIERIKVAHRPSIDRVTGERVLVPKPYYTLEGSALNLHHVPVPLERLPVEGMTKGQSQLPLSHRENNKRLRSLFNLADKVGNNSRMRLLKKFLSPSCAEEYSRIRELCMTISGFQPYTDYLNLDSAGCQLLGAIIRRFIEVASPVPVLIVPLPVPYFYLGGAKPVYREFYESFNKPDHRVFVQDVVPALLKMPFRERKQLRFNLDSHYSPFGHKKLAEIISAKIRSLGLSAPSALLPRRNAQPEASQAPQPTYILGLSCFYHDSGACLIKDGRIVAAAEEERFTRIKNDRRFPHLAANYCLEEAGIHQRDLKAVVYYDNASLTFERLMLTMVEVGEKGKEAWQRMMPSWASYKLHWPQLIRNYLKYEGLILQEKHHRSHAASGFFPSPFPRAAVLAIDGVGEWATASIWHGKGNTLVPLKEMRFPHSLGLFYSAFTQFTGFKVNSGEYKMMGLAPYGQPRYVQTILDHLVSVKDDGSIELNMDYFCFLSEPTMTNDRFAGLFGGPARRPDERITQREMDIAKSAQVVTEEVMLRMARYAYRVTGEENLCLSGGVALNCVANGRLLREGPFKRLWIQPAAGDAGSALGAALDAYHSYFHQPRVVRPESRGLLQGSFLGPGYSDSEIKAFLDTHGYPYVKMEKSEQSARIAKHLAEGKVVGHLSGRAEFGPRSLGSRSILGDPRNQEMQVNLNRKIKYRESFRPFAPSVLAEKVSEYFDLKGVSPYMLLVAPVAEHHRMPPDPVRGTDLLEIVRKKRSDVPAITHVDYSARIQTITEEDHPSYYDLIKAFDHQTGCPVVVNTSFNVRGEPIVCTPFDAYRCFMRTEMDVLVLGHYLLVKDGQPEWPEKKGHIEEYDCKPEIVQEAFLTALGTVFEEVFLPIAGTIRANGFSPMRGKFGEKISIWADPDQTESREWIFEIPEALDSQTADPAMMAQAITQYWNSDSVTGSLRPVVEDLLRTARRFPQTVPMREEVSESVYVMF